ncbi:MAG: M28 family metallopeptidase, partial [Candidatus Acidiferrales bacterium]
GNNMRWIRSLPIWVPAFVLAASIPCAAQLPGERPDPLARIREAAKTNVEACSASGETLCEQVAPKIIANAEGDSPLAENVRQLALTESNRETATPEAAVSWAVAAFGAAGVKVHTETNAIPVSVPDRASAAREVVVAEIRGREKPDEWVLLGAELGANNVEPATNASNAALVVEAARDIELTGIKPRRSIRFVLFTGENKNGTASWAYVRAHRDDFNRARAAIFFRGGANRMTGYLLNGRRDIEPGVREATKPVESLGATQVRFGAALCDECLDFLLEGIPTILADQGAAQLSRPPREFRDSLDTVDTLDIRELKRNTAIAAVTAFGIAELVEPLGPRQSRAEIESLLKATGLDKQMKIAGFWPLWESGQRGRLP